MRKIANDNETAKHEHPLESCSTMARWAFLSKLSMMTGGTHSVKHMVVVTIHTPLLLTAIVFHWEPLRYDQLG